MFVLIVVWRETEKNANNDQKHQFFNSFFHVVFEFAHLRVFENRLAAIPHQIQNRWVIFYKNTYLKILESITLMILQGGS